jgi:hypothetical protein
LPLIQPPPEGPPPSERPRAKALSGCRVLVVDDNRDSADSLGMLLRLKGNAVRSASDGLEAVEGRARYAPSWCCWTSAFRNGTATTSPGRFVNSRGAGTWSWLR